MESDVVAARVQDAAAADQFDPLAFNTAAALVNPCRTLTYLSVYVPDSLLADLRALGRGCGRSHQPEGLQRRPGAARVS